MISRRLIAIGAAIAAFGLTLAVAPYIAAGGTVRKFTVRIEGKTKELLAPTSVRTSGGSITKFGAKQGKCPANSALGALNAATHGHWHGKWYSSYGDYLISAIDGQSFGKKSKDYWGLWVDNRSSSVGACQVKWHPGEQILFAATDGKQNPIALIAPSHATAGQPFTGKVVFYSAAGKSKPLGGATVSVDGHSQKTAANGTVTLQESTAGTYTLTATHAGYIRAAPVTVVVS
jgi:hypothetical protein